jgi:hypothetical protein
MKGVCRVCGCTEEKPCWLEWNDIDPAEPCAWLDPGHTICTNPACIAVTPLSLLMEICFPAPARVAGAA